MQIEEKAFLGNGWSFPPAFSRINNTVKMVPAYLDIEESIKIILGTVPGERIMQPEFGCHLKRIVFEKLDTQLITRINDIVAHALLKFEPRIKFSKVEVFDKNELDGILYLQIDFTVVITNTRHNIVYPFYLAEGTNVTF